jgi:hypothetical protein
MPNEPRNPGEDLEISTRDPRPPSPSVVASRDRAEIPLLSPTNESRLRTLSRLEQRTRHDRSLQFPWATSTAATSFLVALRVDVTTAWTISREVEELDRTFRRAATILDRINKRESIQDWLYPVRPARGGIGPVWAAYGSFHFIFETYGALVMFAQSEPVSLASLVSLMLDAKSRARDVLVGWKIRRITREELESGQPPRATGQADGERWEERTTKALLPVLQEAVRQGQGINFECGNVRLVIPPSRTLADGGELEEGRGP